MAKRFNLTEAESLLPEIDSILREAVSLKAKYLEAEEAIQTFAQRVAMQGGVVVNRETVLQNRAERDALGERLKSALEKLQEFGCVIKDLDIGLVDFPTLFRGREVYLCWRMGEPGIRYWHGLDEGFAGRKQIDQDFLENHQGDRSN
jgi:hypothetical protein